MAVIWHFLTLRLDRAVVVAGAENRTATGNKSDEVDGLLVLNGCTCDDPMSYGCALKMVCVLCWNVHPALRLRPRTHDAVGRNVRSAQQAGIICMPVSKKIAGGARETIVDGRVTRGPQIHQMREGNAKGSGERTDTRRVEEGDFG